MNQEGVVKVRGLGVLLYKLNETVPEFLIFKYQKVKGNGLRDWGGFWGIPLGVIENNENESVKKLIKEHSGLKTNSITKLEEKEDYTTVINGQKVRREINYYLVKVNDTNLNLHEKYETSSWFDHRTAWNKVTTPTVKKVLDQSKKLLEN